MERLCRAGCERRLDKPGAPTAEDDGEPVDEKIARLTGDLLAALDESARLDKGVREQVERLR